MRIYLSINQSIHPSNLLLSTRISIKFSPITSLHYLIALSLSLFPEDPGCAVPQYRRTPSRQEETAYTTYSASTPLLFACFNSPNLDHTYNQSCMLLLLLLPPLPPLRLVGTVTVPSTVTVTVTTPTHHHHQGVALPLSPLTAVPLHAHNAPLLF